MRSIIRGWLINASLVLLAAAPCLAGGSIAGKITDHTNKPLSEVNIWLNEDTWLGRYNFLTHPAMLVSMDVANTPGPTYQINEVKPGRYSVLFMKSGLAMHYECGVVVEEGKETRVDATMVKGVAISGICSLNGNKSGNVRVKVFKDGWLYGTNMLSIPSDDNGHYKVDHVEPGTYSLLATYGAGPGAHVALKRSVVVKAGQDAVQCNFDASIEERFVAVVIALDEQGAVAGDILPLFVGPDGNAWFLTQSRLPVQCGVTAKELPDGLAFFTCVPPGEGYEVKVIESTLGTGSRKDVSAKAGEFAHITVPVNTPPAGGTPPK